MGGGMSERPNVEFNGFGWLALFVLFWWQSGWYRLDCALGVHRACALINSEYTKKETP
jgi:hypothetical protein